MHQSQDHHGDVPATCIPGRIGLWGMRALSVAAWGISGYLLAVSLDQQRLPVGCGAGSGCAAVLASRWSSLLGLPVGGAAAVVYLGVFIATFYIEAQRTVAIRRTAWSLLIWSAAIIAGAALWFISLQLCVIDAICPWCMADHAVGLLLSILIVWQAPIARRSTVGRDAEQDGGALVDIETDTARDSARAISLSRAAGLVGAGVT